MTLYHRIKVYLTEMSVDKTKLENKIMSQSEIIVEHLLKCLLLQDTTHTLNHWSQEIYSSLHTIPKLKHANKLPTQQFIYKCVKDYLGDTLYSNLDSLIISMNDIENTHITSYNKHSLYTCIMNYFEWLSIQLSTQGIITTIQVKEEINTLITQYIKETTTK